MIKQRNPILIYIFSMLSFGIYMLYWLVKTKDEINSLPSPKGQEYEIPTAWLLVIPLANIYWVYKYCEGFATKVKKDNNTVLWFLVYMFLGIIMPWLVQSELNKLATA